MNSPPWKQALKFLPFSDEFDNSKQNKPNKINTLLKENICMMILDVSDPVQYMVVGDVYRILDSAVKELAEQNQVAHFCPLFKSQSMRK